MSADDMLLTIRGLKTHFFLDEGIVKAVDGVDMDLRRGKTLCVVGESGSGKSITARSILQIVSRPGRIVAGEIRFHHRRDGRDEVVDLATLDPSGRQIRAIRGGEIGIVFQEPMTSLSAMHTIGDQIMEAIQLHMPLSKKAARERAIELLRQVEIPRPEQRIDAYTFQLSGGMRQRAMIAAALACNPDLLIADEPTTALDVTTQAQILDLLRKLQSESGMALMLITHDLGVVAEMADDVAVMYLGLVVERGDVRTIFHDPKHPYTRALLRSIPKVGRKSHVRLDSIRGMVPDPYHRPTGCPFHPRCEHVIRGVCDQVLPPPLDVGRSLDVRCVLYGEAAGVVTHD